jgi:predicted permease
MGTLVSAIRDAVRQFRLSPVFTMAVVLTLAVGIGGTTAIFTLINAVMLRSLPVADPERLYRIGDGNNCCVQGGPQGRWGIYSFSLFERLKAQAPEFEEMAAFQAGAPRMAVRRQGVDQASRALRTEYVTGNYFTTLGVGAFGGRMFTAADDTPSAAPVVVVSHQLWQTTYGSDPGVVGATLAIEGHPFTVAGIAPPGFFGETLRSNPADIWIPLQHEPLITNGVGLLRQPISAWLRVIGRTKSGASIAGVEARLTGILRQWLQYDSGYPSNWMPELIRNLPKEVIAVVPAGAGVGVMREQYGESLQILLAVCAMVLLIGCANVANLLLARAVSRRTQTAVRLAVGARRRDIIVGALVESVVLSLAGAIAGLFVAVGAARLLLSLAFTTATFLPISTTPSPLVLAFAFAVAVTTGVIFGTVPAWFAARTNPIEALRGSGRTAGDRSSILRSSLLVVQATLSVVLVAGAAMLGRSLNQMEHQDLGYPVPGRVLVAMNRPPTTYSPAQLSSLYRALETRLARLPGVTGGGLALYNPLSDNWGELIMVDGQPVPQVAGEASSSWDRVSANYLRDLGLPVVRGRHFTEADDDRIAPVAVVSETFAKRFFKNGEDPIGKRFGLDEPQYSGTFQIVGIVRDAKFSGGTLKSPLRPMFYAPLAQTVKYDGDNMQRLDRASHLIGGIMLVTAMTPGALEPILTKAVAEVDPNLTLVAARTLGDQLALAFDQDRAVATLAGLFGVVSLVLAAIGLYGTTSYNVARRTSEIGLRMALGADRRRVVGLVLRSAFVRVGAGLALGVPLAIGAGRLIASRLYGVSFWDPMALGTAAGLLLVAALIAAFIPAARAAAIAPTLALRAE